MNTKEYFAKWRDKNRDKYNEYQRNWKRALSPERRRTDQLKRIRRQRGLTPEQYDAKLALQNNLCRACGKPFDLSSSATSPVLDHDHITGVNRDFCHSNCNVALGMLNDDPEMCRKLAEYLERHNAYRNR